MKFTPKLKLSDYLVMASPLNPDHIAIMHKPGSAMSRAESYQNLMKHARKLQEQGVYIVGHVGRDNKVRTEHAGEVLNTIAATDATLDEGIVFDFGRPGAHIALARVTGKTLPAIDKLLNNAVVMSEDIMAEQLRKKMKPLPLEYSKDDYEFKFDPRVKAMEVAVCSTLDAEAEDYALAVLKAKANELRQRKIRVKEKIGYMASASPGYLRHQEFSEGAQRSVVFFLPDYKSQQAFEQVMQVHLPEYGLMLGTPGGRAPQR